MGLLNEVFGGVYSDNSDLYYNNRIYCKCHIPVACVEAFTAWDGIRNVDWLRYNRNINPWNILVSRKAFGTADYMYLPHSNWDSRAEAPIRRMMPITDK